MIELSTNEKLSYILSKDATKGSKDVSKPKTPRLLTRLNNVSTTSFNLKIDNEYPWRHLVDLQCLNVTIHHFHTRVEKISWFRRRQQPQSPATKTLGSSYRNEKREREREEGKNRRSTSRSMIGHDKREMNKIQIFLEVAKERKIALSTSDQMHQFGGMEAWCGCMIENMGWIWSWGYLMWCYVYIILMVHLFNLIAKNLIIRFQNSYWS